MDILDIAKNVSPPIVTFVLGFFVSRFTMSKNERMNYDLKRHEVAVDYSDRINDAFQKFSDAMAIYVKREGGPVFDDFVAIATSGENYFYQMRLTSDAIIGNKVDVAIRDTTLVPKIKECVERTIPDFYNTLKQIADKHTFDYTGKFEKSLYSNLYKVIEKYGKALKP